MASSRTPFPTPIYVTRPLLPDYHSFSGRLREIWDSQQISNMGPQHQRLEAALLDHLGARYISLFNNGTTALLVAIKSLRLQGEVITTPFSFPATTHALAWNNITPIFCDIDPDTMTIDPRLIGNLITERTSAILGVHVYGIPCHVHQIKSIAEQHGLRVIYDAAHAFGVTLGGHPIGSFGDISMFSFHPTKLFHTGEGGALVFGDANLKTSIDLMKNFGIKNEHEVEIPGINGKMNELSALMGLAVLELVHEEKRRREGLRRLYTAGLGALPGISVINSNADVESSEQYFVIRINPERFGVSRNAVYEYLKRFNVHPRKYFYPLISDYPCYNQLPSARAEHLPNAKAAGEEVLCLPFYGKLKEEEVTAICEIIREAARH